MAEASDRRGMLYQNLLDAGCDKELIKKCMVLMNDGRTEEALRLLSGHRTALLDNVHQGQKQIDCLDFLTYRIEKNS